MSSSVTLWDCSPPGSSVHGILQSRILEWVAMPPSRGSSWLGDRNRSSCISCIVKQVIYHWHHLGSPHRLSVPLQLLKFGLLPLLGMMMVLPQLFLWIDMSVKEFIIWERVKSVIHTKLLSNERSFLRMLLCPFKFHALVYRRSKNAFIM